MTHRVVNLFYVDMLIMAANNWLAETIYAEAKINSFLHILEVTVTFSQVAFQL